MRLPRGQPLWQNGMEQSIQRPPWARASSSVQGRKYSPQSRTRSLIGRRGRGLRALVLKPVGSPTLDRSRLSLFAEGMLGENAFEVTGHHFNELWQHFVPVVDHPLGVAALGVAGVSLHEGHELHNAAVRIHCLEVDH